MLIRNNSNQFKSTTEVRKFYDIRKLKRLPLEEIQKIAKENGIRTGEKSKMRLIDEIANYTNCL